MGHDPSFPPTEAVEREDIRSALFDLGFIPSEDNIRQMGVFLGALSIYQQREKARGGIWKEFPPDDKVMHLKSKIRRVEYAWCGATHPEGEQFDLDDAFDILNYAAFFIRQVLGLGEVDPR